MLYELLQEKIVVFDGAMGTQLQKRGLPPGHPPEEWNLSHPEEVTAVHKSYVQSGSDMIQTNTFGGNRYRLRRHRLSGRIKEINEAAVFLVRQAAQPGVLLAASIGPLGEFLEPFGEVSRQEAEEAFEEQIRILYEAGIRIFHLETFSFTEEALLALGVVERVGGEAVVSFTFEARGDGRLVTLMGEEPQTVARLFEGKKIILGANCGTGIKEALRIFEEYRKEHPGPFSAKPNAGVPRLEGGQVVYDETPDNFSTLAPRLFEMGVRLVGGCCGTHEGHIAALRRAVDGFTG